MVTLEHVRASAAPELYPRHVLAGCDSALVLFAAAFHGQQDAVWMAEAGMTATCVDLDAERLEEMSAAYPDGWEFVNADVFEFAARAERQWDVVSIDCPTNLFDRCAELLPLWTMLARHVVILGTGSETKLSEPPGWGFAGRWHRSNFRGGICWAVFKP